MQVTGIAPLHPTALKVIWGVRKQEYFANGTRQLELKDGAFPPHRTEATTLRGRRFLLSMLGASARNVGSNHSLHLPRIGNLPEERRVRYIATPTRLHVVLLSLHNQYDKIRFAIQI
jgi:hypothetical protein